ncbi:MAG: hypothetical protein ACI8TF_001609 [Paracoccaceae bacterium]|jgi:hypothetical protein
MEQVAAQVAQKYCTVRLQRGNAASCCTIMRSPHVGLKRTSETSGPHVAKTSHVGQRQSSPDPTGPRPAARNIPHKWPDLLHCRSPVGQRTGPFMGGKITDTIGVAAQDRLTPILGILRIRVFLGWVEGGPVLTQSGATFIQQFGVDLATLQKKRRTLCRACLDRSKRRAHLAGSLGRGLFRPFWTRMGNLGPRQPGCALFAHRSAEV